MPAVTQRTLFTIIIYLRTADRSDNGNVNSHMPEKYIRASPARACTRSVRENTTKLHSDRANDERVKTTSLFSLSNQRDLRILFNLY